MTAPSRPAILVVARKLRALTGAFGLQVNGPGVVTLGAANNYTGGTQVTGPQGNLQAAKTEMYLGEGGDAVERVEGYGAVTVRLPPERVATGDRLQYFGADERYVLTGATVTIVEKGCETKGKTLTFFKSADRMIVDGNEQTRTQTKGGTKCGEPRFD